jgi:hypothetical protein
LVKPAARYADVSAAASMIKTGTEAISMAGKVLLLAFSTLLLELIAGSA